MEIEQPEDTQLLDLNFRLAQLLIPNDVILCLYLLIGLFGNALVIYIYTFRMDKVKNRDDRYFIPYLACMDFLGLGVGASFALCLNVLPILFRGDALCKSLWFVSEATSISSSLLLLVIAVHRYMKVCTPFEEQMTQLVKRAALVMTVVSSCLMSFPVVFFYEEITVTNRDTNITGYRCFKKEGDVWQKGLFYYNILLTVCAVGGISGITILYGFIGKTIYKQFQRHRNPRRKSMTPQPRRGTDSSFSGNDNQASHASEKPIFRNESNHSSPTSQLHTAPSFKITCAPDEVDACLLRDNLQKLKAGSVIKNDSIRSQIFDGVKKNDVAKTVSLTDSFVDPNRLSVQLDSRRSSKRSSIDILREHLPKIKPEKVWNHFRAFRYSYMFMSITLVFVISYIPRMVLMMYESVDADFWSRMTNNEIRIYLFLYRMYILNHVCNPFIYGMFDEKFRENAKHFLCPCISKNRKTKK